MDLNQSKRDGSVVRGYLAKEEQDNGAAIKKAIEGVISDMAFVLQSEAAERTRMRIIKHAARNSCMGLVSRLRAIPCHR
jgi:hypothetical protein